MDANEVHKEREGNRLQTISVGNLTANVSQGFLLHSSSAPFLQRSYQLKVENLTLPYLPQKTARN